MVQNKSLSSNADVRKMELFGFDSQHQPSHVKLNSIDPVKPPVLRGLFEWDRETGQG